MRSVNDRKKNILFCGNNSRDKSKALYFLQYTDFQLVLKIIENSGSDRTKCIHGLKELQDKRDRIGKAGHHEARPDYKKRN
jgi:hypothetical protein